MSLEYCVQQRFGYVENLVPIDDVTLCCYARGTARSAFENARFKIAFVGATKYPIFAK